MYTAFFILLLCLLLCGCSFQNTHLSQDFTNESTAISHISSEENCTELSEEEIRWFNTEFFNTGDRINMRNMMLICLYQDVKDINLFQLFYNGTGTPQPVSDREKELLTIVDENAAVLDIIKVTSQEINAFLLKYAGISFSDCNQVGLDEFIFLQEYDAYYLIHGDIEYATCNILSGVHLGDDTIVLKYELNKELRYVTLREMNAKYQFIANSEE